VVRDVATAIERKADVKLSPLGDILQRGGALAVHAEKGVRDWAGMGLDALQVGGEIAGLPGTTQILKPLRYYHRVQQGKIQNPNLWDAFVGAGARK
jgi:hypothetical protein